MRGNPVKEPQNQYKALNGKNTSANTVNTASMIEETSMVTPPFQLSVFSLGR